MIQPKFLKKPKGEIVDTFDEQVKELMAARFDDKIKPQGCWVYYPWLDTSVHILNEEDFYFVRTSRNRNLITAKEQKKFYNAVVGIGGLSIGNSVAVAIALQGGAKHMRLADFDRLELSNTNRIRTGVQNLGLLKVEIAAREIYEINPYAKVECFTEGLTEKNIEKFISGLDVMIDELDNIAIKYLLREQAKKHKIPVVMAADNGDRAVVDVERYDRDPQPEFFHGRIGNVSYEGLKSLDKMGIGRTIAQHIGHKNVTQRMHESLAQIGKTIVSWPQLGGAAMINGSAVAYCVRKIVTKQPIVDNRAIIDLDKLLY